MGGLYAQQLLEDYCRRVEIFAQDPALASAQLTIGSTLAEATNRGKRRTVVEQLGVEKLNPELAASTSRAIRALAIRQLDDDDMQLVVKALSSYSMRALQEFAAGGEADIYTSTLDDLCTLTSDVAAKSCGVPYERGCSCRSWSEWRAAGKDAGSLWQTDPALTGPFFTVSAPAALSLGIEPLTELARAGADWSL